MIGLDMICGLLTWRFFAPRNWKRPVRTGRAAWAKRLSAPSLKYRKLSWFNSKFMYLYVLFNYVVRSTVVSQNSRRYSVLGYLVLISTTVNIYIFYLIYNPFYNWKSLSQVSKLYILIQRRWIFISIISKTKTYMW